ncbi:WD40 domain-containing protein [Spirosoma gilvum]
MNRFTSIALFYFLLVSFYGRAQKPELVVPIGHTNHVFSVAFSPDGRYALSGSYDKSLKLWEVKTGREIRTFTGHTSQVVSVAISPNSRYALSGSWDKSLKLWDITSGQEVRTFTGHEGIIRSVAFSPDGHYVLSGSMDKTLKLWDVKSGRKVHTFKGHTDQIYSVTFSSDGKHVLSGSRDKTLKLWNIETGREVRTFTGHTESVESVTFSPDGHYALSGSHDKTLKLWDVASGQQLRTLWGHTSFVSSVAFSPDGHYALSGSWDNTLKLWDVASGQQLHTYTGHTESVESVAFSSDSRYALSGSHDNTLKLWDVQTGQRIRTYTGHTSLVESVAFSPDGRYALLGEAKGGVYSHRLNERGNTLKLWDFQTGQFLRTFIGHTDAVHSVAITPDGHYALSGSYDNTLKLWSILTGQEVRSFRGHKEQVYSVAISPNGKYALSGSSDDSLKIWDIQTGLQLRSLIGHTSGVRSVAFSPDGRYALSGSHDKTLKLWDVQSGQQVHTFKGHTDMVIAVAFSPDGKYALSGSADYTLKLWDVQSGQQVHTFKGHTGMIKSVTFSPDNRYVLSGAADKTLKLWDMQTRQLLRTFRGHADEVESVAFSPDSRFVTSGSWDTTTKLWDIGTGNEIATLIAVDYTDWVVTTPTGLFDASPGAMKLMHYVVNDSTDHDEPWKVINLDQLIQRYHQPGLLPILIGYKNERLRQVPPFDNATLPPDIKLSIQNDKLVVQLNNQKGGIGSVSVFINGAEIVKDLRKNPKEDSNQETLSLELPLVSFPSHFYANAPNSIRVVAKNGEGWLRSRPVEIDYKPSIIARGGEPEKTPSSTTLKTVRFRAVVVGTSNIGLRFAHSDAEQIANGLELAATALFSPANVSVQLLVTKPGGVAQTTKAEIVKALEAAQQTKAEDIFVLHISGHAVNFGGQDGDLYFLTALATSADVSYLNDSAIRQQYALSTQELIEYLKKIPAKKKVLILDVCSAGKGAEKILAARDVPGSQIRALNELQERMGLYVLAGSAADAVSYEANVYGQGLVTYALLEGMRGAALRHEGEDEFLDVEKWFTHVENRVPILAKDVGGIQKPYHKKGSHLGDSVPGQATEGSFSIGKVTESVKAKIHIANPKLILLVKNFQEDTQFEDVLDLKSKVESALNDLIAAWGSDAPILTMDVKAYPGAYTLNGRYRLQGEELSVSCTVFRTSVLVGDFIVTGTKSKLPDLVQAVLTKAQGLVKP